MTPAEQVLWRALRNDQLGGRHFRRQQIVGGYIVDFYCAAVQLAIELDGAVHLQQQEYDLRRDRELAEMGIRTMRIANEVVTRDLDEALRRIAAATSPP